MRGFRITGGETVTKDIQKFWNWTPPRPLLYLWFEGEPEISKPVLICGFVSLSKGVKWAKKEEWIHNRILKSNSSYWLNPLKLKITYFYFAKKIRTWPLSGGSDSALPASFAVWGYILVLLWTAFGALSPFSWSDFTLKLIYFTAQWQFLRLEKLVSEADTDSKKRRS